MKVVSEVIALQLDPHTLPGDILAFLPSAEHVEAACRHCARILLDQGNTINYAIFNPIIFFAYL